MVPYFADPQDDEQDDDHNGGFQAPGAGPSAPPQGAGAQGPKPEKTGSGFTNIDKYVQANKNQGFGGQVVGKVQADVDKGAKSMQDAASSFSNKVNTNQVYGKEQVDQALNNPGQADAAKFQAGIDQQYKGPKALAESQDDYNRFTGDANKAQTAAGQLSNEAGRFSLLDNYFGRNNYGFGQKSLDNALFQADPNAGKQANAVQKQANNLQSQGAQMQQQLQSQASQRAGEIEQARNYQRQQLGFDQNGQVISGQGAYGELQKQLADTLTSQNAQRQQQQTALQDALSKGDSSGYDLSDEQLSALGIDPGTSTYGVNLSDYIKNNDALGMDQVASDEQRARLGALNQLVGQGHAQNMLGDKQNATSAYSFDKNRFMTDVDAARSQAQQNIDQTKAQYDQAAKTITGGTLGVASYQSALDNIKSLSSKYKSDQARLAALAGMRAY